MDHQDQNVNGNGELELYSVGQAYCFDDFGFMLVPASQVAVKQMQDVAVINISCRNFKELQDQQEDQVTKFLKG